MEHRRMSDKYRFTNWLTTELSQDLIILAGLVLTAVIAAWRLW